MYRRILINVRKHRLQRQIERFLEQTRPHLHQNLLNNNLSNMAKKKDKNFIDLGKGKTKKIFLKSYFF
jgi:hypothetical protein